MHTEIENITGWLSSQNCLLDHAVFDHYTITISIDNPVVVCAIRNDSTGLTHV